MRGCEAPAAFPPEAGVVGVLRTPQPLSLRVADVSFAHGSHAPPRRDGTAAQVADVVGEIAAAMAYLEALAVRLHAAHEPGGPDAATIPPSTLIALRRSCQRVELHSHRALVAVSPRRAEATRSAAAQLREVEALRFSRRMR